MTKNNNNEWVSWASVNNTVPIIVSIVSMVVTFGMLMTRVAVLETKMDTIISLQRDLLEKNKELTKADEMTLVRLERIETQHMEFRRILKL